MGLALGERHIEDRPFERRRIRGVGNAAGPVGAGELPLAPGPDRLDQLGVAVVDEVRERRGFAVLLAHEQHRRERRQHDGGRSESVAWIVRVGIGEQAGPRGRVADVVVVGVEHDETSVVDVVSRRSATPTEAR